MKHIRVTPISAEEFSPFGNLLTAKPGCARLNFAAPVNNFRPGAEANLAIVKNARQMAMKTLEIGK